MAPAVLSGLWYAEMGAAAVTSYLPNQRGPCQTDNVSSDVTTAIKTRNNRSGEEATAKMEAMDATPGRNSCMLAVACTASGGGNHTGCQPEEIANNNIFFIINTLAVMVVGTTGNLLTLLAIPYVAFRWGKMNCEEWWKKRHCCSGIRRGSPGSAAPGPSSSSTSASVTSSTALLAFPSLSPSSSTATSRGFLTFPL